MRSISITALSKYRKFAIHDKNVPDDILKIKLNCLIDATDESHIFVCGNTKTHTFGNCSFIIVENIIKDNKR